MFTVRNKNYYNKSFSPSSRFYENAYDVQQQHLLSLDRTYKEHFLSLNRDTLAADSSLNNYQDVLSMSYKELANYIKDKKQLKQYTLCLDAINEFINRQLASGYFDCIVSYASEKASILRKIGRPNEVIEFCKELKNKCGERVFDVYLLTSLASAYCDIGEWTNARRTINYAYKQVGENGEHKKALNLVLKRINDNSIF